MRHVSDTKPGRGRKVLVAVALAGFALASVTAATRAAAAPERDAASALPFFVDGLWTDNGNEEYVMFAVNSTIFVDMRRPRRPNATGTVVGASTILVNFPDDNTYLGTFVSPTFIRWSNGTTWHKVYRGPQIFDVEGQWNEGVPFAANIGRGPENLISVDLNGAAPGGVRPGFIVNATTIRVEFPGGGVDIGTLQAPNILNWVHRGQWRRTGPIFIPPGPPQCLRTASLLC